MIRRLHQSVQYVKVLLLPQRGSPRRTSRVPRKPTLSHRLHLELALSNWSECPGEQVWHAWTVSRTSEVKDGTLHTFLLLPSGCRRRLRRPLITLLEVDSFVVETPSWVPSDVTAFSHVSGHGQVARFDQIPSVSCGTCCEMISMVLDNQAEYGSSCRISKLMYSPL